MQSSGMNSATWCQSHSGEAGHGRIWALVPTDVIDAAPSPDVELLRRIADGDAGALSAFYDQHASLLFGLAHRILNDLKEAEDVLQEVLLQIWTKSATYDPAQGRPLAWVLTLTRHKAIDRLRATERRRARLLEPTDELPDCPAPGASAPELAGTNEQGEVVRQALATLPVPQRRAIELAFFDGLTQTEVAAALNEPLGTVKARIRRGMLKLRDELAHRL